MSDPGADEKVTGRRRADGRRQLLVYLPQEVIKEVKKVAVDDDTTASAITDEALRDWLRRRTDKAAKTAED
ncbi:hypothetical protein [Methylobacterium sp. E-016]|uniref:hypothetical protein n=1 Tax=Methylobacterium sp. E-016 TaxID=2836556 RepID=UPI001FBACE83|nr:hypothetical protein [Methylobacterium sp. E-016]